MQGARNSPHTLLYSPCVTLHAVAYVRTLKNPNAGTHTTVWPHENTAPTGRNGYVHSAALVAAAPYLGKATPLTHKGQWNTEVVTIIITINTSCALASTCMHPVHVLYFDWRQGNVCAQDPIQPTPQTLCSSLVPGLLLANKKTHHFHFGSSTEQRSPLPLKTTQSSGFIYCLSTDTDGNQ